MLQATALVNEVYLKLIDIRRIQWQDRAHSNGQELFFLNLDSTGASSASL